MFLDDEEATTRLRLRRLGSSIWIAAAALAACVVMMLALVERAQAGELPTFSEVVVPQLLFSPASSGDQRVLFGALTLIFTMAAAGLWRLSFRDLPSKTQRKTEDTRISRF
ncbi:hypothetical protein SAMN05880590_102674 [Rhizobium sp. RU35A]|uniref:hypothetical protein n=1 Tax=Rhizobium sp. RU35A TaxID=1907414 RepID=UPI000955FD01|nr:hypothetical protein [Rhizobium sp. RU35A]SIQ22634.1 hypothetical protein SAMN05880590_102674 [Rhizobium sp. RU35A]